ncbi:MAG TPA: hypothetical protein VG010_05040 [Solirubrobacteraceae bacterium]|nr:hypothetical protein [Solirubrobacteraceae bacterium]
MGATAYKLVGFVLWRAGKWYLRKRLSDARPLAVRGLAVAGLLAVAAVLARRAMR